jgi:hypothetical protein
LLQARPLPVASHPLSCRNSRYIWRFCWLLLQLISVRCSLLLVHWSYCSIFRYILKSKCYIPCSDTYLVISTMYYLYINHLLLPIAFWACATTSSLYWQWFGYFDDDSVLLSEHVLGGLSWRDTHLVIHVCTNICSCRLVHVFYCNISIDA